MLKNENYSLLSKLLHGLALGNNFIPEMLHDIEIALLKKKINSDNLTPHIFISGMARSGSTILMRFLYQTKFFASFTYRDMPFIMSPNLWSKISNKIKPKSHKERIHGDSISINIDSPEALEEVFWRVKLQKNYIYTNKLNAHEADDFIPIVIELHARRKPEDEDVPLAFRLVVQETWLVRDLVA